MDTLTLGLITFGLIVIYILIKVHDSKVEDKRVAKIKDTEKSLTDFTFSIKIIGIKYFYLFGIDKERRKIVYIDESRLRVVAFDNIINVELLENTSVTYSKSTLKAMGGSIIGGAVAGSAGAIVGGLSGATQTLKKISKVQVKIRVRDMAIPSIIIDCFDSNKMLQKNEVEQNNYMYQKGAKNAQQIIDFISVIIDSNTGVTSKRTIVHKSCTNELVKLAELREKGFLTEEEFNEQKTILLNETSSSRNTDI